MEVLRSDRQQLSHRPGSPQKALPAFTPLLPVVAPAAPKIYSEADLADKPPPVDVPDDPRLEAPRTSVNVDLVLVHKNASAKRGCASCCGCSRCCSGESPQALLLERRRALHARMRCVGLELGFEPSRDGEHTLVKLKAPDHLLEAMAERIGLSKRLISHGGYGRFTRSSRSAFAPSAEGWTAAGWGGSTAAGNGQLPRAPSLFTSLERIQLLLALLERPKVCVWHARHARACTPYMCAHVHPADPCMCAARAPQARGRLRAAARGGDRGR